MCELTRHGMAGEGHGRGMGMCELTRHGMAGERHVRDMGMCELAFTFFVSWTVHFQ